LVKVVSENSKEGRITTPEQGEAMIDKKAKVVQVDRNQNCDH
jgi:hypothetical protein